MDEEIGLRFPPGQGRGTLQQILRRVLELIAQSGAGIGHLGVVGKFSTRNPAHENEIGEVARSDFRHVSLGHRMSGNLNFRRRIATTYLNASIFDLYSRFVGEILDFAARTGLAAPIYILKADGGTIEIRQSADQPVQTILSGPAASIMGILSLADCSGSDAIAMDMGGTTTDIALLADGVPLLEPLGVTIEGHRTLIRGLKTKSIGLGGDSRVRVDKGEMLIGPRREGPAAAFGGPFPTPTDAMIILGLTRIGDRAKAETAVAEIAGKMNTAVPEAARAIFEKTCQGIASAVTTGWSVVSGPGIVTFADATQAQTTASFSAAGTYVLRLTASDGDKSSEDTVTVSVLSSPGAYGLHLGSSNAYVGFGDPLPHLRTAP